MRKEAEKIRKARANSARNGLNKNFILRAPLLAKYYFYSSTVQQPTLESKSSLTNKHMKAVTSDSELRIEKQSEVNPMYQYLVIHGIAVQHLANKLNEYAKEDWRVKALIEGPNELPLALLEREATSEALKPPFGQLTEDEKKQLLEEE